jgi:1-acyl-sn-glycerol-3-phosphate acyltransferase
LTRLPVPPWLIRRLFIAPLMPILAVLALVLLPVVIVGQAICAVFAVVVLRHKAKWRLPRVWSFAVVYLFGETACLVACFGLWVASGFGRRLQSERQQRWHLVLLRRFLAGLVAVAGFVFRFRLDIEEPTTHPQDADRMAAARPILVLARHAGPGASFVLVHLLLSRYERRPRVVLKEQLRLDPSFDVLLTRLGCKFIPTGEGHRDEAISLIAETAAGLEERDALLLYPEGGDWTPTRHRLAVAGLRKRGRRAEAAKAVLMPHVLPPKPGGTLAALNAAPNADVVVFTHTGHDELLDIVSIWNALPLRAELRLVWWREGAWTLPSEDEQREAWLLEIWTRVDAWIGEQIELARVSSPPTGD